MLIYISLIYAKQRKQDKMQFPMLTMPGSFIIILKLSLMLGVRVKTDNRKGFQKILLSTGPFLYWVNNFTLKSSVKKQKANKKFSEVCCNQYISPASTAAWEGNRRGKCHDNSAGSELPLCNCWHLNSPSTPSSSFPLAGPRRVNLISLPVFERIPSFCLCLVALAQLPCWLFRCLLTSAWHMGVTASQFVLKIIPSQWLIDVGLGPLRSTSMLL